jgi:hypothetical protein
MKKINEYIKKTIKHDEKNKNTLYKYGKYFTEFYKL